MVTPILHLIRKEKAKEKRKEKEKVASCKITEPGRVEAAAGRKVGYSVVGVIRWL